MRILQRPPEEFQASKPLEGVPDEVRLQARRDREEKPLPSSCSSKSTPPTQLMKVELHKKTKPVPVQQIQNDVVQHSSISLQEVRNSAKAVPVQQVQNAVPQNSSICLLPNRMTLDKETLKLEKEVRDIEKLKQKKSAGSPLDADEADKIERAVEISEKLRELYSAKFDAEQPLMTGNYNEMPAAEAFDSWSQSHEQVQRQPKKRAGRGGRKGSSTGEHIPVVIPPRTYSHDSTLRQIWQSEPLQCKAGEDSKEVTYEDFELAPLNGSNSWGSSHLQFQQRRAVPWSHTQSTEEQKDDCWEWVTTGACPRGTYCRWKHRPLGNEAAYASEIPVLALNSELPLLNLGSDSDEDE